MSCPQIVIPRLLMSTPARLALALTVFSLVPTCLLSEGKEKQLNPELQQCIDELKTKDKWYAAIAKLCQLGKEAQPAAPALREKLKDQDPFVRGIVLKTLGCIQDEASIPEMIRLLKEDPDDRVKKGALYGFGRFGYGAKKAIPAMVDYLDKHEYGELTALYLGWMGPEVHREMSQIWEDRSRAEIVRQRAIRVLLNLSGDPKKALPAVPSLLRMLDDSVVAEAAAEVLGHLELTRSKETIAVLEKHARKGATGVRVHAAWALFRLDRQNPSIIPAMQDGLKVEGPAGDAAEYLGTMSRSGSSEAADVIADNINHADPSVRTTFVIALRQLGSKAERLIPKLQKWADNKDFEDSDRVRVTIEMIRATIREEKKK